MTWALQGLSTTRRKRKPLTLLESSFTSHQTFPFPSLLCHKHRTMCFFLFSTKPCEKPENGLSEQDSAAKNNQLIGRKEASGGIAMQQDDRPYCSWFFSAFLSGVSIPLSLPGWCRICLLWQTNSGSNQSQAINLEAYLSERFFPSH